MSCCKGKSARPSKRQQAINLVLSVSNVIAHALKTGKAMASSNVVEKRVQTCKTCRHLEQNRCNVCGCFINIKAGLISEKCPLNLW